MIYIFLAALFYTGAIMFGTLASRSANTSVVSTIMNVMSALIPLAAAVPVVMKKGFEGQKTGILFAIVAGVAIALFTLALNKSYAENKVAIVAPIVFGGAIFLSAILSSIIFKEKISVVQGSGLFLLAVGLGLVIFARAVSK